MRYKGLRPVPEAGKVTNMATLNHAGDQCWRVKFNFFLNLSKILNYKFMITTSLPFHEVEKYIKEKYRNENSTKPKFFFRGQTQDYSSIKNSISVVAGFNGTESEKKEIRTQAHKICMLSGKIAGGMSGTINIDIYNALALLQHYLWLSPVLDITGTLEVAMFFAWSNPGTGKESIIYIIKSDEIPDELHVYDHDFLMYNLDNGGIKHRWLKQDGYGICPKDFHNLEEIMNFDLLNYKQVVVECVKFKYPAGYKFDTDLMDETNDALPCHFQSVVRNVCEELYGEKLHGYLKERINKMFIGQAKLTVNNFGQITGTYLKYGNLFTICFLKKALNIVKGKSDENEFNKCLKELNNITNISYWNIAVHASSDYILDHIKRLSAPHKTEIFEAFQQCYEKARVKNFPDNLI